MADTTDRKSKRENLAEAGALSEDYAENSFFKVYPAYGIDKIKFSFVQKGSSGKGWDIYMDIDEADNLFDDVLSFRLWTAFQNETSTPENKYPCSYSFCTGDNGEKEIKLSKSRLANAEVNVYARCNKEYMNIPTPYSKLRTLAKWFKRTSKYRFEELTKITLDAMSNHQSMYHNTSSYESSMIPDEQNTQHETAGNEDTHTSLTGQEQTISSGAVAAQQTQTDVTDSSEKNVVVSITSEITVTSNPELYTCDIKEGSVSKKLYFNKQSVLSMGMTQWEKLQKKSATKTAKPKNLNIAVIENKGAYLLTKWTTA